MESIFPRAILRRHLEDNLGEEGCGRKPSYWPHCLAGLKADFAPGHLSEGILRDSRLGLPPKNIGEIE